VLTTGRSPFSRDRKNRILGQGRRCLANRGLRLLPAGLLIAPIKMGATAFVMAFLSRPYVEIALAAAIPSVLF